MAWRFQDSFHEWQSCAERRAAPFQLQPLRSLPFRSSRLSYIAFAFYPLFPLSLFFLLLGFILYFIFFIFHALFSFLSWCVCVAVFLVFVCFLCVVFVFGFCLFISFVFVSLWGAFFVALFLVVLLGLVLTAACAAAQSPSAVPALFEDFVAAYRFLFVQVVVFFFVLVSFRLDFNPSISCWRAAWPRPGSAPTSWNSSASAMRSSVGRAVYLVLFFPARSTRPFPSSCLSFSAFLRGDPVLFFLRLTSFFFSFCSFLAGFRLVRDSEAGSLSRSALSNSARRAHRAGDRIRRPCDVSSLSLSGSCLSLFLYLVLFPSQCSCKSRIEYGGRDVCRPGACLGFVEGKGARGGTLIYTPRTSPAGSAG